MHDQRYRPDIDGLRAIAVLAVLLFHAAVPGFDGGYVGVDIFFVISGFLITGVIHREMQSGRYSLARFYERRARRIMPALLTVIAAVLAGAAWLYLPGDFEDVPRSALAAVGFVSNVWFFTQTGYFDTAADFKPLLHTWSLGVEEQFYIGFPILLMLLRCAADRARIGVIAAGVAASFALAVWMTGDRTGFAFFLAPTRVWELGVGALLALGAVPEVRGYAREAITLAGLAAVIAGVTLLDRHSAVPGAAALLPVLGTAALLHSAPGTRAGRMLATPPMVGVGLISYSLYLWHWPVLAFARYVADRKLTLAESLALLAVALVLAILSWRFVEQPFRKPRQGQTSARVLAWTGGAMATVGAVALAMIGAGSWPQRFDPQTARLAMAKFDFSPYRDACHDADVAGRAPCVLGAKVAPTAMLWGDSHGVELAYAVSRELARDGRSLIQRTHSSCPPVIGYDPPADPACARENDAVLAQLLGDAKLRTVYLAAFWAGPAYGGERFAGQLDATIARLAGAGKQVFLFGPVPPNRFDVPRHLAHLAKTGRLSEATGRTRAELAGDTDRFEAVAAHWAARGVTVVDPLTRLCPSGPCRLMYDGRPLYFDNHHLSVAGAEFLLHPSPALAMATAR